MSLCNGTKAEWEDFSNGDWSDGLPPGEYCPMCDGPVENNFCRACREAVEPYVVSDPAALARAARDRITATQARLERVEARRKELAR